MGSPRALIPTVVALLGAVATLPWLAVWARHGTTRATSTTAPSIERRTHPNWVALTAHTDRALLQPYDRDVSRHAGAEIHGTVTDAQGTPVEGAEVTLLGLPELWDRAVLDDALIDVEDLAIDRADAADLARTAADGTFSLPLKAAFVGVVVAGAVGTTHTVSDVVFADDGESHAVAIVLKPAGVAFGVITRTDGSPAAFVEPTLEAEERWVTFQTDAEGRFRVEGLPYAHWAMEEPLGQLFEPTSIPIALDRETRATLGDANTLTVHVSGIDGYDPLDRLALVHDHDRFSAMDTEIRLGSITATFDGLASGTYEVLFVRSRGIGHVADVAVYGGGPTGLDTQMPAVLEPLDGDRGRRLQEAGIRAESELCVPSLEALVLHGRAVVARSATLEGGDVIVALGGHRVGATDVEALPNWHVECVAGDEVNVLVRRRGVGPVVAVAVPRIPG